MNLATIYQAMPPGGPAVGAGGQPSGVAGTGFADLMLGLETDAPVLSHTTAIMPVPAPASITVASSALIPRPAIGRLPIEGPAAPEVEVELEDEATSTELPAAEVVNTDQSAIMLATIVPPPILAKTAAPRGGAGRSDTAATPPGSIDTIAGNGVSNAIESTPGEESIGGHAPAVARPFAGAPEQEHRLAPQLASGPDVEPITSPRLSPVAVPAGIASIGPAVENDDKQTNGTITPAVAERPQRAVSPEMPVSQPDGVPSGAGRAISLSSEEAPERHAATVVAPTTALVASTAPAMGAAAPSAQQLQFGGNASPLSRTPIPIPPQKSAGSLSGYTAAASIAMPFTSAVEEAAALTSANTSATDAAAGTTEPAPVASEMSSGPVANMVAAPTPASTADRPFMLGMNAAVPTMTEQTVTRELDLARDGQWLDRLTRDIAAAADGNGRMSFRLNPETLGSLHIEVARTIDGLDVRMTTDSAAGHSAISEARGQLVAEAQAQGVRISETHVTLKDDAGRANQGPSGQASGGERQGGQHREQPPVRTAARPVDPAPARSARSDERFA